jgi:hypothetical protein
MMAGWMLVSDATRGVLRSIITVFMLQWLGRVAMWLVRRLFRRLAMKLKVHVT